MMFSLHAQQRALVIGLDLAGQAACELLLRRGLRVAGVDENDTPELRRQAERLRRSGAEVILGAAVPPEGRFDLAVTGAEADANSFMVRSVVNRGVPLIGELELGCQQIHEPVIAVAGTNGKSTVTNLVEAAMYFSGHTIEVAGWGRRPVCQESTGEKPPDYWVVPATARQLASTREFRPKVAVLMNLYAPWQPGFLKLADYAAGMGHLFVNQGSEDWAIIQSETLAALCAMGLAVPSKIITFSARNRRADLSIDDGRIVSRLGGERETVLELNQCRLRGGHNAENLMAAWAISRVLGLPREASDLALASCGPASCCCETVATYKGVVFMDDSKAGNLPAMREAVAGAPANPSGEPNIWLITSGRENDRGFHELGSVISHRAKHVFLLGKHGESTRAAWNLFTPCTLADSLLEAVLTAAEQALPGDVVLLSPADRKPEMFQDYRQRGKEFRESVRQCVRAERERGGHDSGGHAAKTTSPTELITQ